MAYAMSHLRSQGESTLKFLQESFDKSHHLDLHLFQNYSIHALLSTNQFSSTASNCSAMTARGLGARAFAESFDLHLLALLPPGFS